MINKFHSNKRGFTLIELIVVIAVLLVLVTIAVPKFMGQTQKATLTKHLASAKTIEDAANIYNIEKGRFPRLSETAYTSEEVTAYADNILSLTGEEVILDPDGNYYDIDYVALKDYVTVPKEEDKGNYILQNPVGKVFYLEGIKDGRMDGVDFSQTNPEVGAENTNKKKPMSQEERDIWIDKGYTLVSTSEDLSNVRNNLIGKYIQTNDIDLVNITEFEPIGANISMAFQGVYNGGNFTISNLTISRPSENSVGLFASAWYSKIENVGLINVDIKGNSRTGGIVGNHGKSTISNCYTTGNIVGIGSEVGGLVGSNYNDSKIINSYSKASVLGNTIIGGLAGKNYTDSVITFSYSAGKIFGAETLGGLVGANQQRSIVSSSYSTAPVVQDGAYQRYGPYVGGLVGINNADGKITSSYSIGKITSNGSSTGGLVGGNGSTVNSSYYDKETSEMLTSSGGNGLLTSQMQQKVSYSGWDFDTIWQIEEGKGYPTLQWQNK